MQGFDLKYLVFMWSLIALCTVASYNEQMAKDLVPIWSLPYAGAQLILDEDCGDATKLAKKAGFKVLEAKDNSDKYSPITVLFLKRDSKKQLVVSFSGTKHQIQLFSESLQMGAVDYTTHPIEGSKVAKFFHEQYNVHFREYFREKLAELCKEYPRYDLYFTGHSLGGALANIAAADTIILKIAGNRKVYLYTYGQPRVANTAWFKGWVNEMEGAYRIVHNNDIVAHLPSCMPSMGGGCAEEGFLPFYPFHATQEIFYKDFSSDYKMCDIAGEDERCSNGEMHMSVDDHLSYFDLPISQLWNTHDHLESVESLIKA
jgi:hypothetical protein